MVRSQTEQDWQVIEKFHKEKRHLFNFWKKPKTHTLYELYVYVGGCGHWQIINFYRDKSQSSISTRVPAELILAYLYGKMQ